MLSPQLATLAGLLLAAPLTGLAQTTDPAPAPRFYVGLGAYHSYYQTLGSTYNKGFNLPLQLTAGYQLRPRLALELGVAYSGVTTLYAYDGYYANAGGTTSYYEYANTTTERITSVAALARYALTRRPAHRLQFDVLGGVTLMHRAFYSRGFEGNDLPGSLQTTPFEARGSSNDLLLTAGLGLRYRLSPRFALNLDLTTNRNLSHGYYGFTNSAALGLRYRFGK